MSASDMRMHHMLIILTLTFIHGHTDLSRENNKCSFAHHVCCEGTLTKGSRPDMTFAVDWALTTIIYLSI